MTSVSLLSSPSFVVRSDLRALAVSGADRVSWLTGMITCDLAPLRQNCAVYGLILDKAGKILADLVAFKQEQRVVLAVDASSAPDLQRHLDHFLIMEDAEIEVVDQPHSFIVGFGPRLEVVVDEARKLPSIYAAAQGQIYGTKAVIVMVGNTDASRCVATLASALPGAAILNQEQFEQARFHAGIPKFGPDFNASNYPMEAELDNHAISFSKGCYVGQEVVVKLRSRGKPVRLLKRLFFPHSTSPLPAPACPVANAEGKTIGKVTSAARLHNGNIVAFALLRRAETEKLDEVFVEGEKTKMMPAWGEL